MLRGIANRKNLNGFVNKRESFDESPEIQTAKTVLKKMKMTLLNNLFQFILKMFVFQQN